MVEQRVLLLALRGRDAQIIGGLLAEQGHESLVCAHAGQLAEALAQGAGTALITEESLAGAHCAALGAWLGSQEPWSDFPFILLATKRAGIRPRDALRMLDQLGNVVVLERPVHRETLESAVSSALRGRRRQYEARERLAALRLAEERLTQLNASLEARIDERTFELSEANNQLMQEVAERERAQAALVQAQKVEAIGQLTGGIAHDFNNLLTVVSGNIELIEHRATDERVLRYAERARQATARAAKLTHQLLAFSRTQQLTLEPIDLNALVEGMQDLLDRTIGPHVEKRRTLTRETLWVMGDSNQIELAILNLAINARDAMPDGGRLAIETRIAEPPVGDLMQGRFGVVTVSDTGTGIPKKILSRVVDPFFTTKPLGKGTGLGLSQVFGIARQSGGTAIVDSTEGVGTSVSIWLPIAPARPAGAGEEQHMARPIVPPDRHVLVIDDDDGVRRFMVESLEMLGYRTAEASSGAAGLEKLAAQDFDALVVDFAMNGLNGAEVAARAKAVSPRLPVILVTGYAEIADGGDAFDAVLRKPFKVDGLADALRTALVEGAG
jgi:signal transduction histidine kinase/CheY-like chemotaxis protein